MFDRREIRAAVEAGVLSSAQAEAFESFLKSRNDPDRGLDSENLRFLTNFNDIFLAIGMGVLMFGVIVLSMQVIGPMADGPRLRGVTLLPVIAVAWALAEYFCGRRRLLLPSMVLAVFICASAAVATNLFLATEALAADDVGASLARFGYLSFGASLAAALAIFVRFRLPFALFLAALSLAGCVYVAVAEAGQAALLAGGAATLVVGCATLVAGIIFDARDPSRSSLNSDNAFWLHLAAAPQIMFGLRGLILGSGFAPAGSADAAAMLAALIVFGVLSLALNRRALIVSGLLSFATAIGALVDRVGGGDGATTLMLTALVVGASIVLLGGGWRTARRALLRIVPHEGAAARIFPPEPA
ncbi:hypothetical protein GC169_10500 [bacterium]|nr:hypothetical protein [bacterium]